MRTTSSLVLAVFVIAALGLSLAPSRAQERPPTPSSTVAQIDDAALERAAARTAEWITHGRTHDEQRFSPLRGITSDNVAELGLAWSFDTETDRGLESTPIVVDGVMYATGSWSVVFALDARTGKQLWRWDPQVDRKYERWACCDVVNRGAAVYKGRVYVGVLDGRLVALDARTGSVVWSIVTVDQAAAYTITGAPRIVRGKVVIGNGGAEYGVRGYVSAYDAETGELAWRIYTVPGDPSKPQESKALERAVATWSGDKWWEYGGGGTVWDSMAYYPRLNLLCVGTGNGGPWNQQVRSPQGGDNLYLCSILALNPDSGELVWHYQTTPGDTWDYTSTQHLILADLPIGGQTRQVIMQAPKNGFFYVLDRRTGAFISAEPYVNVNWASHIDKATGRPVLVPGADYRERPYWVRPAPLGGHNWQPMSFSPDTGLVYLPAQDNGRVFATAPQFTFRPGQLNTGVTAAQLETPDPSGHADRNASGGRLLAWDPVAQKARWKVEYDAYWNGGTLATAGNLVFQGTAAGDIHAYRATDGQRLWSAWAGTGVLAPPMSYELDGKQYVTVVAGWGGAFAPRHRNKGRVLTFTPMPRPALTEVTPIAFEANPARIARGSQLYLDNCQRCHNPGTTLPDLRRSAPDMLDALSTVLLRGSLLDRGMPPFRQLNEDDVAALREYVLDERRKLATRKP
jgi:quinohemoprotein ethanol dehydrogenase